MEVILLQDVGKIGKAGDRVRVRDGFSRNYLFPKRLAVPVTESGLRFLEAKKKRAEEKRREEKEQVLRVAERLEKISCVIKAKVGEGGKLFGSVTRQDISAALLKEGLEIEKRQIDLFSPVHQVGTYQIRVSLHPEVEVILKVIVVQA